MGLNTGRHNSSWEGASTARLRLLKRAGAGRLQPDPRRRAGRGGHHRVRPQDSRRRRALRGEGGSLPLHPEPPAGPGDGNLLHRERVRVHVAGGRHCGGTGDGLPSTAHGRGHFGHQLHHSGTPGCRRWWPSPRSPSPPSSTRSGRCIETTASRRSWSWAGPATISTWPTRW